VHRLSSPLALGSPNFFSLRATLTPPLSPKGQDLASSSYQHTVVLNYTHIFILGLANEWDIYGAGPGGKLRSVRKFSWYLQASVKDTRNIWLLFCMIYLHCKFYNVIKISYGGPGTGHVRPAGHSLETPALAGQHPCSVTHIDTDSHKNGIIRCEVLSDQSLHIYFCNQKTMSIFCTGDEPWQPNNAMFLAKNSDCTRVRVRVCVCVYVCVLISLLNADKWTIDGLIHNGIDKSGKSF
jgi:hypothetical protein